MPQPKRKTKSESQTAFSSRVAVRQDKTDRYPNFPYYRDQNYPELAEWPSRLDPKNDVFSAVREVLNDLGLDSQNFGSASWNPFGQLVKPGARVVLKPNWVVHQNQQFPSDNLDELVTHSSVIRVIIEYVALALRGKGKITIADAPIQSCNFNLMMKRTRFAELMRQLAKSYPEIKFELIDLRKTLLDAKGQKQVSGDPYGYSLVNLGGRSLLTDLDDKADRYRVTNYDHRKLLEHHHKGTHRYLLARAVLDADLIINLPKMKCHIKGGVTGAMKNMVGINGNKEFLPHHVAGSAPEGGDQYIHKSALKRLFNRLYDKYWSGVTERMNLADRARGRSLNVFERVIKALSRDPLFDGGWIGNETVPRMTIDLNHALYYYQPKAKRWNSRPRAVLSLIDGIIAGEKNGPLKPTAKPVGILIASFQPVLADAAMAVLMGYEPRKIKTVTYALSHPKTRLNPGHVNLDRAKVIYNGRARPIDDLPSLRFVKPTYWVTAER